MVNNARRLALGEILTHFAYRRIEHEKSYSVWPVTNRA